jgi:hypothetical protein
MIPIGGVIAFLAAIAFLIGAAQDGKTAGTKADVVKHVYFYLTAFITLLIIVGAGVTLLNVGMRTWVLTKADQVNDYRGTPPPLYVPTATTAETEKLGNTTILNCDDKCAFTASDKTELTNWKQNYTSWKAAGPSSQTRATTTVAALSFLIVGLLAFWFHWRVIQKEQQQRASGQPLVTRAIYFWAMALLGLLMTVIAGGFLLNVGLKAWLYPNADNSSSGSKPIAMVSEQAGVDSIIACATACGFSADDVQLANDWKADYERATGGTEISKSATRQSNVAMSLPFLLVGIPLFLYHWMTVRRKDQISDVPPTSSPAIKTGE